LGDKRGNFSERNGIYIGGLIPSILRRGDVEDEIPNRKPWSDVSFVLMTMVEVGS